jgi:hypothetical protein
MADTGGGRGEKPRKKLDGDCYEGTLGFEAKTAHGQFMCPTKTQHRESPSIPPNQPPSMLTGDCFFNHPELPAWEMVTNHRFLLHKQSLA